MGTGSLTGEQLLDLKQTPALRSVPRLHAPLRAPRTRSLSLSVAVPSSGTGCCFQLVLFMACHSVLSACFQPLLPEQPIPCIKSHLRKCLGRILIDPGCGGVWYQKQCQPGKQILKGGVLGLVTCVALSAMLSSLASDSRTPNPQCARASLKETSTPHHDAEPGESRASGLLPQVAPPLSHCPRTPETVKNSPSSHWRASRIKMVNSGPSCLRGSHGEAKRL